MRRWEQDLWDDADTAFGCFLGLFVVAVFGFIFYTAVNFFISYLLSALLLWG